MSEIISSNSAVGIEFVNSAMSIKLSLQEKLGFALDIFSRTGCVQTIVFMPAVFMQLSAAALPSVKFKFTGIFPAKMHA